MGNIGRIIYGYTTHFSKLKERGTVARIQEVRVLEKSVKKISAWQ